MYTIVGYNEWWLEWVETNLVPGCAFATLEEAQKAYDKLNQLHQEKYNITLEDRDALKIRITQLNVITADKITELSNLISRQ